MTSSYQKITSKAVLYPNINWERVKYGVHKHLITSGLAIICCLLLSQLIHMQFFFWAALFGVLLQNFFSLKSEK